MTTQTPAGSLPPRDDSFARYSRWALAGALLVAVASVTYRIEADRAAAAAADQARQAALADQAKQLQMAEGMVAQLEAKLHEQPDRVEGWVLLMRSRMSLGQPDKARAARDEAIKANPGAEAEIRAQARALGVE